MNEKKSNIQELPVIIPSEIPKIYATGVFGGISPLDFKIFFFSEEPKQQDEEIDPKNLNIIREVKAQISLSPLVAKQIAIWLTKQVELYEKQISPINIPESDKKK